MSPPLNTTNLSLAGVLKWLLLIFTIPFWIGAWNGIVRKELQTSGSRFVSGPDAVKEGLLQLLYAGILILVAWAIWRFWQNNED